MKKTAEVLILLLQVCGAALVVLGLWIIWRPLALMAAGGGVLWIGHRLWLELDRNSEEDGYQ